ncbi:MAG: hypothetical protein KAT68_01960 [Bacteroidales bacterium]|nr:hypothetical protein [Bacteroidales bacterium]
MEEEIKDQEQKVDEVKENVSESTTQTTTSERPGFLSVLCILSYIGSGLGFLFTLLGVIGLGALLGFLSEYLPAGATDVGIMKPIINLILFIGSLYGVFLMWKVQKLGFYIYAGAQVLLLVFGFGIMALIFTALFILLYGLNFKHMK